MADRKLQVFFYGGYMNMKVLEDAGIKKRAFAPASINGYELVIQPYANIVEAGDGVVYGILANMTHAELATLYGDNINKLTGTAYLPEAMLVFTRGGKIAPAIVYIADDMTPGKADNDYVDSILKPAEAYGFPAWYREKITAFKS
ncbi:gamma-glutamylcyclotransferase [Kordiimonas sp.]|uniref:gamma-glutamylcyclotransferase n=1 Tax=Kordiimonas sp. TaxID=1970157 RepID=UPI003A94B2B4